MMKLTLLLFACGLCIQAQTRTVTFDGFAGSTTNPDPSNPLIVSGMSFGINASPDAGAVIVVHHSAEPFSELDVTAISSSTPYLGMAVFPGDSMILTFPNGTFGLLSIDFSKLATSDAAAIAAGYPNANTINLLGTLAGGGTVTTTFRLNGGTAFQTFTFPSGWQNLASVKITANRDGTSGPNATTEGIFAMDNIVYTPVCGYALHQNNQPTGGRGFNAGAATGSFGVAASPGCTWSASGMPEWITSTSSGTGNGSVSYQVQANTGAERAGVINVGDQTFKVEQANGLLTSLPTMGRFAHVTSGGTWKFTLVEINLGIAAALGRLTFVNEAGNGLQLPLTFPQSAAPAASSAPFYAFTLDRMLNPNAQFVMESTGPDNIAPLIGSGAVSAVSGQRIRAFGIFSNPTFRWDAVVPPETRDAPSYVLAFDNTGALATGVAVSVFGDARDVGVIIRDATGAEIGTDTINLPLRGHISFMLFEKYPTTVGKRGTIEFVRGASGQITVLGLRANGGALTSLPVMAQVGTGGGTLSHVTYNGGFTSVIYVVNTGSSSASFTLSFFGDNGSPHSVPLSLPQSGTNTTTSQLTRDLAPGAMLVVETQAQDALANVSGSALLTTTGNVSAFEIFRWTTFGQEASVPLTAQSPVSYALVFDNTGGLTTGVALANPSAADDNIIVIVRDDLGVELGRETINLKGRGHTSFMLPTRYPFAAGKRGVVILTLSHFGSLSAVGLRAKADGTLTTIPVLPGQPLPLNPQ